MLHALEACVQNKKKWSGL